MTSVEERAKQQYQKDMLMSDLRLQSIESAHKTGFMAGAKLYEDYIALLIFNIEEFLPEDSMIRHSNSFRTLKHLIEN